jgi:ammonium transporter, Amt family
VFKQQLGLDVNVPMIFYFVCVTLLVLAIPALIIIDAGFSRKKNSLDTWVQRLGMAMIAALGFGLVGYGVWNWQFYQAFGIHNALWHAIKDWWAFGPNLSTIAAHLDPKIVPQADVFQVFSAFDILAAALVVVFIAGAALERAKPVAMFVIAAIVGAVWVPLIMYLSWGPAGPLNNWGVHDFVGIFFIYIFSGAWAFVLAWRLGPRLGYFKAHEKTTGPVPHNMNLSAFGIVLLLVAITGFVPGCGFLIPGQGYFGIHMTTTGFGVVFYNLFVAFGTGGLGGVIVAYWRKNPVWALIGPIAGYISATAMFDIARPWEIAIVSFFAPFVAEIGYRIVQKLGVDDPKISPINLFVGVYGAIIAGFVGWHIKAGGYPGGVKGFEFQHATITPLVQIGGTAAVVAFSFLSALVTVIAVEKTIGLRVSEDVEIRGLDAAYWSTFTAYGEEAPQGAAVAAGSERPPESAPLTV